MLTHRGDNKKTESGGRSSAWRPGVWGCGGIRQKGGCPGACVSGTQHSAAAETDLFSFDPVGGGSCYKGEGKELFLRDGPQVAGLPNPGPRLPYKESDLFYPESSHGCTHWTQQLLDPFSLSLSFFFLIFIFF